MFNGSEMYVMLNQDQYLELENLIRLTQDGYLIQVKNTLSQDKDGWFGQTDIRTFCNAIVTCERAGNDKLVKRFYELGLLCKAPFDKDTVKEYQTARLSVC